MFASATGSVLLIEPIPKRAPSSVNPGGTKVDALRVTVELMDALPLSVGGPLVEIVLITWWRAPSNNAKTWIFFYKDSNGNYLEASVAKNIRGRTFVLPDLDILERQDAQTEIYLTRNADIVPGKTIAEPFVYTTPRVSFEGPLHPTLVNDDLINLATIFSNSIKDKPVPVLRTLQCQLSLLYEALFAKAGTDDVTLQLSLYYEYEINPAIERVRLPIYLMAPTKTAIRDGGSGVPIADIINMQVNGWQTWYDEFHPETKGGKLCSLN